MENEPLIDEALKARLAELYRGPGRHYHGLAHVQALLALAAQYRALLADPEAVEAAIWFHDAVYDSRAKDNEARSAEMARESLAGRAGTTRIERIAAMIEATAVHQTPDLADRRRQGDAALLLDMDLSILGAAPAAFEAYENAVRREYDWVDDASWRTGRGAVLKGFLARPHIFHTQAFRERFEAQARGKYGAVAEALEDGR